ncbi:cell division protein ZipA [Dokdonella fugitiva]|jgi:cell division protein ZipA|uniref:Cell division protein ZipA n=1 Tax=Dokdonella fugitiva TaxID=328517 RepID=A0A4R2I8L9_9GAMM|nr:cell division protein ZipA [Dokdonella fugitiva]MBA8883396.1 cell division protein ZipA [Dokdonella fugitiva]TCO40713.1 cell division protein ZipA [Dokdonella fugitiva]
MEWNASVGIPLIIIGAIVLLLIYLFGRPKKPEQGERRSQRRPGFDAERVEPTFGDVDATPAQGELDVSLAGELERLGAAVGGRDGDARPAPSRPSIGARPDRPIERIVTLFVASRTHEPLAGPDIVVAAEKAGLEFGDMGIFHRLVLGKKADGPVFSMANMVKPGHFDMARLDEVSTPGVTLFMTLPGPLPALDAWEMLLPTAQRLAELLDAQVLDEGRNALGRQRIAHIRDELRAWDRQQERQQIRPGR